MGSNPTLSATYEINTLQAWLTSNDEAGTFTAAICSDGGDVPGTLMFSAGASAPAVVFDDVGQALPDWFGPSGLDWLVGPGTYGIAFEVHDRDTFEGFIGTPTPNPPVAQAVGTSGGGYAPNSLGLSFRIEATPVPIPAAILLLPAGLLVIGRRRC